MLRHGLGVGAAIGRHRHAFGKIAQRNEIDPGGQELNEARAGDECRLAWPQFPTGVPRQQDSGCLQRRGASLQLHILEMHDLGDIAERLDDGGSSLRLELERNQQG